ncbi:hypothetical protein [Hymenobacter guriensis]|uniref:Glycerophosphoryl diester phosphodiesterase membrane domain-containing protein n=1 Tax=Hymenobacter guriensis TaxID=2793065 RepID=A0ABS0L5L6_9BACT|nr:hypothetical protein [Hymenobacter guriensis]MBG8555379.1 hypothetical protein [Hymenobacter guriensis]
MKTTFTRAADFQQERDFGQKISATFEFLGTHWRPLLKCLAYFVLPGTLLAGIGLGLMMNSIFNQVTPVLQGETARISNGSMPFGPGYFIGIGVAFIGGIISFALLLSTVYAYVRLLYTDEPAPLPQPRQVWLEMKPRLGRVFLSFGVLGVAYLLLVVVLVTLIALAKVVGVALLFLVMMPALLYVVVPLSLFFPAMWLEDLGIFAALRRSFQLVAGRWWATLALLLVASLIQGTMSFVFIIPFYASMFGKILKLPVLSSDVFGMVVQCLYMTGVSFLYVVSLIASAFQFFHLVEQKEGHGLLQLVASLGQTAAPAAANSAYSPTDDGEY